MKITSQNVDARLPEIMADPAVSDWAKNILITANSRDIADAVKDVRLVQRILQAKFDQLLATCIGNHP